MVTFLNGPQAVDGDTRPTKRPTQRMVRPKDRSKKPLKKEEALEAEKATGAGTQI